MKILMMGFDPPVSKLYYHWKEGLKICGDEYKTISNPVNDYSLLDIADCYYQTNMIKPKFFAKGRDTNQGNHFQYIINSTKPYIVSETTPFRKHEGWMRFGWNSYKWTDGNFNNESVTNDRWRRFVDITNIKIKDWHSPGDNILIMGQKEGDSSIANLYENYQSFYHWMIYIIEEIRKYSDRPIVVRPHPKNELRNIKRINEEVIAKKIPNVYLSTNRSKGGNQGGESLEKDLQESYCVVTYNSNSGVEAICEGIPTFALENGSMVYPISHHDISRIENLNYDIDKTDWQNKIAYTIWNKEDVQKGTCWNHLKGVYFNE